jgi:hypothetical protein
LLVPRGVAWTCNRGAGAGGFREANMVKGLTVFGLIAGGIAAWLYWDEILEYLEENTRTMRDRAAESLETAERMIDEARPRIDSTLRAGVDAIRSAR